MNDREVLRFIQEKIPIILDIEKQDLKFDTRNEYYKVYRYIYKLQEENKRLKGE